MENISLAIRSLAIFSYFLNSLDDLLIFLNFQLLLDKKFLSKLSETSDKSPSTILNIFLIMSFANILLSLIELIFADTILKLFSFEISFKVFLNYLFL